MELVTMLRITLLWRYCQRKEEGYLTKLHVIVRKQIIWGKYYKITELAGTEYIYFKPRARAKFPYLSEKEFTKFAEKVSDVSRVYDNWDRIVENLPHPMQLTHTNFLRAMRLSWCIRHNSTLLLCHTPK